MKKILKDGIAFNKIGVISCLVFFSLLLSFSGAEAGAIQDAINAVAGSQACIDAVAIGKKCELVYVEPGTYIEDITMKEGVDVIGADNDTTIIQGSITGESNTKLTNFKVKDGNYVCPSGKANVEIKDNVFYTTIDASYDTVISLPDVASAEIVNNSIKVTSSGSTLTGIEISGTASNVLCTNNSLSLGGATDVNGIVYAGDTHIIKNNAIKTDDMTVTGSNPLDVNYNLLFGGVGANVGLHISNLTGVDPIFVSTGDVLGLQNTSPGKGAADSTLYAMGVTDIGIYDNVGILRSISEIQSKINDASPGATVYIEPGIYSSDVMPYPIQTFRGRYSVVYTRSLVINKDLTLKAIDPDRANTVIALSHAGRCIAIMDPRAYEGSLVYDYNNREVDDVTIDGFTISGVSSGREMLRVWVAPYNTGYGSTEQGHWSWVSQGSTAPIFNFSRNLTLKNCDIQIANPEGVSISTWEPTVLSTPGTTLAGSEKRTPYLGRSHASIIYVFF